MTAASSPAPVLTRGAPHVRDELDVAGLMRWFVLALVPCILTGLHGAGREIHLALGEGGLAAAGWRGSLLAALGLIASPTDVLACTLHGLLHAAPLFLVSLLVVMGWELLFARMRARPRVPGALLLALLFTLAVPLTLSWWQAAIGLSFGVVLGKEVFGGTGRNIVHPAVAALTFLALAWPDAMRGDVWVPVSEGARAWPYDIAVEGGARALRENGLTWGGLFVGTQPGPLGAASPLAALLGAAILATRRLLAWRTVVAVPLGVVVAAGIFRGIGLGWDAAAWLPGYWQLVLGSITFGTVFFATDPVTSPASNAGRWIHGLLIGGVVVMIRVGNPSHPEGTWLVLLLGSIFAPLNDAVVVWLHTWRRARV